MYCCHVWVNGGLEAIRFMFRQYLASGTILFISRSHRVSGGRLMVINTGSAN